MRIPKTLPLLVLLSAASLHCGGEPGSIPEETAAPGGPPSQSGESPAASPSTPVDTAAPTVVAISPSNGAKGVRANAKIVITFSEPMNKAATEAAYASTALPASDVSFLWNTSGTELTVVPKSGLAYAKVGDLASPPKQYAVAIGGGAKDLAGNALTVAASTEFSTLRELFLVAPLVTASSGRLSVGNGLSVAANPASYFVGDGDADQAISAFFTFDLAALPEGAEIAEATFMTRQTGVTGSPYADLGPGAMLARTSFVTLAGNALNSAAKTDIGALSTTPDIGARQLVVTAAVAADLADRVANQNRSQFRLAFAKPTDTSADIDRADFIPPEMSVTYLMP